MHLRSLVGASCSVPASASRSASPLRCSIFPVHRFLSLALASPFFAARRHPCRPSSPVPARFRLCSPALLPSFPLRCAPSPCSAAPRSRAFHADCPFRPPSIGPSALSLSPSPCNAIDTPRPHPPQKQKADRHERYSSRGLHGTENSDEQPGRKEKKNEKEKNRKPTDADEARPGRRGKGSLRARLGRRDVKGRSPQDGRKWEHRTRKGNAEIMAERTAQDGRKRGRQAGGTVRVDRSGGGREVDQPRRQLPAARALPACPRRDAQSSMRRRSLGRYMKKEKTPEKIMMKNRKPISSECEFMYFLADCAQTRGRRRQGPRDVGLDAPPGRSARAPTTGR